MNAKTHRDYQSVIGETCATGTTYLERRANKYYFDTFKFCVKRMLGKWEKGAVLDVGTSHGNWFGFLKEAGFSKVFGVEIDAGRAALAQACGYEKVYVCDAANIPHPSGEIDAAVSNDVFVHILRLEDKIAVLKEVERLLRPGGAFVLNHAMSSAYGHQGYTVDGYCSFLSLNDFIDLVKNNTSFQITDIKPTYFMTRGGKRSLLDKLIIVLLMIPFGGGLVRMLDFIRGTIYRLEDSDTVYIKLVKPSNQQG